MKVAVVTSMFIYNNNKTDECTNFKKIPGFDYILFTNNKNHAKNLINLWEIREIHPNCDNGLLATKLVKWQTHLFLPDYDIIIWVDLFFNLNINLLNDIKEAVNLVYNNNIDLYIRTQNFKNINVDISWCLKNNRISENRSNIFKNYAKNIGIDINEPCETFWSSAIIFNNKLDKLQNLGKELFELLNNVCYRDQFWLPYLFKKYNIKYSIINKEIFIISGKQNDSNNNYANIIDNNCNNKNIININRNVKLNQINKYKTYK